MSVTIYHNPRCSKSRQTLEIIRDQGSEPEIVEYLKTPITAEHAEGLFKKLGLPSALHMIRVKEPEFKEAGLSKTSSNAEFFQAIENHPKLLERPIVTTPKGAVIGRPPERVSDIL